jgi:hypothetical protein
MMRGARAACGIFLTVVVVWCAAHPAHAGLGIPGRPGEVFLVPVPDTLPLPAELGTGVPAFATRAVQLSLPFARDLPLFPVHDLLEAAARDRFTTVIFDLNNVVRYASAPELATETSVDWSLIQSYVRETRALGLRPVVGLELLGHADALVGKVHPELLLDRRTFDPRLPATKRFVTDLLDEVVDSLQVTTILIGHDGAATGLDSLSSAEARQVFVQSVRYIRDHLARRHVRTAIWSELLLGQEEFPGLSTCKGGRLDARAVRRELPDDLVVLDLHASPHDSTFASVDTLASYGFTVWGATGLDRATRAAFARYASKHGARGMLLAVFDYPFKRGGPVGMYREMRHAATVFWNPRATPLPDPAPPVRRAAR